MCRGNREGTVSEKIVLDSSMVEHTAVNRGVVGSSPTRGVKQLKLLKSLVNIGVCMQRTENSRVSGLIPDRGIRYSV